MNANDKRKNNNLNFKIMTTVEIVKEFLEQEARSCSMESGCVTAEYVYRMKGGSIPLEEIVKALEELN